MKLKNVKVTSFLPLIYTLENRAERRKRRRRHLETLMIFLLGVAAGMLLTWFYLKGAL